MPRALALLTLLLSACFEVPELQSGDLLCDNGRCPPGFSCATDGRCRRPGAPVVDAPLGLDGPARDGRTVDASSADRPPPDAPVFDARPCTEGDRRCGGSTLEVCVSGSFVPALPSCASMGQSCFDPGEPGGTDAYCGTCLKGAKRCTAADPPVVQSCPATGLWTDETTCSAGFGCVDSDGENGPAAYCGECTTGDLRCAASVLRSCVASLFQDTNCAATAGFTCFDPGAAGGSDAYCGACVKDQILCRGDARDQCNSQGTGFVTIESCTWGCFAATASCCAAPDCGGRICGIAVNACDKTASCGTCNGICCFGGDLCCGFGSECCDGICCGGGSSCCEPGICSAGPCP